MVGWFRAYHRDFLKFARTAMSDPRGCDAQHASPVAKQLARIGDSGDELLAAFNHTL